MSAEPQPYYPPSWRERIELSKERDEMRTTAAEAEALIIQATRLTKALKELRLAVEETRSLESEIQRLLKGADGK